jgi:formylglycine-generating enzyme required for sulfatase activity
MNLRSNRWGLREALLVGAGALLATAVFLLGYAARATVGMATKDTLAYAGTLKDQSGTGAAGPHTFVFTFTKAGDVTCTSKTAMQTVSASGAFAVDVDLTGQPGCAGFFDGSDVSYSVTVDGTAFPAASVASVPYAKYADQVGESDCPRGYARLQDVAFSTNRPNGVLCGKGQDQMVKVGTGPMAYWIDRYEASLWDSLDATGTQYGIADGDADKAGFFQNGQSVIQNNTPWKLLYAVSRSGVKPSRYLTWFQAQEACRASGKALPNGEEWLHAARGTPDIDPGCAVTTSGPWNTGMGSTCVSNWGAEDMIGNLWEWTAEWYAGLGRYAMDSSNTYTDTPASWPNGYNGDSTVNIASTVRYDNQGDKQTGLPAAAFRGGSFNFANGSGSGVFTLALNSAPSLWSDAIGFRCIIR